MMESGKNNGVKWGNRFGYMILPFHLAKHDDPLEYVRKATKVTRRKKSSMEAIFTYWSADMVVKLFGIKVLIFPNKHFWLCTRTLQNDRASVRLSVVVDTCDVYEIIIIIM
jgi:hypothetical protein